MRLAGYKQRSTEQLHKEGEAHAQQLRELRERVEDMRAERDDAKAAQGKLNEQLMHIQQADPHKALEAANGQVDKLTRTLSALERDNLKLTGGAGGTSVMQAKIAGLEKEVRKAAGAKQR